jgi:Hint domain
MTIGVTGTYGFMYFVQPSLVGGGTYDLINDGNGPDQVNAIATNVGVVAASSSVSDGNQFTITGFPGTFTLISAAYETTFGPQEGFVVQNSVTHGTYFLTNQEFTGSSNIYASQLIGENTDNMTICFLAGTNILTPSGEVHVEDLKPGDRVLTVDGRSMPVRWIGRQSVSRLFADPLRVLPIRVKAGAFVENVPARDLLVSPDHALLVDGVLIQAGALVNGTSITREENVPASFTYYHVEVDEHSLILAEGAPAETFVDNVDRIRFDNWDEYQALYLEGKAIVEMPYPRAKAHRQVPTHIRARLAERAQAMTNAVGAAA